jgi:integrase
MRWGELVALRPRHIDFLRKLIAIENTVVGVSRKNSHRGTHGVQGLPQGQGIPNVASEPGPSRQPRRPHRLDGAGPRRPALPPTRTKGPISLSRNTFRTKYWLPALERAGIDFQVRVHDLRHAHASWLLAGGADLKTVMDRLGHAQIQTTQKYLHSLPDADDKALAAFTRVRHRTQP